MRRTLALGFVVLLGLSSTLAAQTSAQQAGGPPPVNPGRQGRAAQRNQGPPPAANPMQAEQQVQRFWNTFVLEQSQRFLGLSDQQYPNFFLKMQALQGVRDRHIVDRRRLIRELGALTGPERTEAAAESAIVTKTRELDDLETQSTRQEQDAIAAIDATLTPFQRARFRVFQEQMERRKMDLIAQALGAPAPPVQRPNRGGGGSDPTTPPPVKPGRGGGGGQ